MKVRRERTHVCGLRRRIYHSKDRLGDSLSSCDPTLMLLLPPSLNRSVRHADVDLDLHGPSQRHVRQAMEYLNSDM